ncbi:MAG: hypothetical protein EA377_00385 [Phycisphaerales bacterium]|nr:MAG: hypothetical protein EA377_00385 [Phycisphaerales bacterium]
MIDEHRNGTSTESRDTELGRSLHLVLRALDERYGRNDVVQQLGDVGDQLSGTHHLIEGLARRLERHEQAQREQTQAIRVLADKHGLLEQASVQNSKLTDEHYRNQILRPLVRHLLDVVDLADAFVDRGTSEHRDALVSSIFDLLDVYDVQTFVADEHSRFDPNVMKPVASVPTCTPDEDQCVHSTVRRGASFGQMLLRPVTVRLYRYDG